MGKTIDRGQRQRYQGSLRSILFWPDRTWALFEDVGQATTQLDGALELMEFADSYVLNDRTAIAGITWHGHSSTAEFIESEVQRKGSIETIGYGPRFDFDITPLDLALDLPKFEKQLNKMKADRQEYTPEYDALADHARVLQAQSYIMLADREGAVYVPERLYGWKALEAYHQTARRSPHFTVEKFKEQLVSELMLDPHQPGFQVSVPCFLAEALRESHSPTTLWESLRQLRNSASAKKYREMMRVYTSDERSLKEKREAVNEIQATADAMFSGEGLKSRVPKWAKWTIGLSAGAIGILFPPAALPALAVPFLLEGGEEIDNWLRRRSNIFSIYARTANIDLYSELKRHFPHLKFGPPHLDHFLRERNFGWPDEFALWQYLADTPE